MSNYSTPIYTSMSNTIKATIAIVSLIIIATAGVFILGKNRGEEASKPAVQSSSSVQSFIKSNQSNSNISNSQQINSKVAENKSISTLASQNQFASYTLPKSETVDGVQVTYLDSNNPPQYIKDYLACETKMYNMNHVGVFLIENENTGIEYRCPPKNFLRKCNNKIVYAPVNDFGEAAKMKLLQFPNLISGWNCANPDYFKSYDEASNPFGLKLCESMGINETFTSVDFDLDQINHSCIVITNSETHDLLKKPIIQDIINNFKRLNSTEIKSILII
jgi:hypothetical protein